MLDDLRAADPTDASLKDENIAKPQKLSAQYGGEDGPMIANPRQNDITATNLGILVDVAARSATAREREGVAEAQKLKDRGLGGVSPKEMGDVLRSANLTINIDPNILLGENSVFAHPNDPLQNIWHLAEQGIKPKGDGYLEKREGVEKTLFPEMTKHARNVNERPVYGALNVQGSKLGAASTYGSAYIVLKPEVAKRATYTLNDSFVGSKVKITPQRRADFYALLDGAPGVPQALKEALKDPNSTVRKDFDAWLDRVAANPEATIDETFRDGFGPSSMRELVSSKNRQEDADNEYSLQGLLIKCFGDSESTRSHMVSHDNLESLLPQIGDVGGNALARAAMQRKSGQPSGASLQGANYIEAQIHGPIIPTRDIAEIHINIQDFDVADRQALLSKVALFESQTGIKVVMDNYQLDKELDVKERLEIQQDAFNKDHVDMKALNAGRQDVLTHLRERVAEYLASPSGSGLASGLPEGVRMNIDGAILAKIERKFLEEVDKRLSKRHSNSAEDIIELSFKDAVRPILVRKRELLKGMADLQFETAAQKTSFANWVCASGALKSVAEMKLIHKHSVAQAAVLKELAAMQPPPTADQVLARLADLSKTLDADLASYKDSLGPDAEFGPDDKMAEYSRISSMALSMLKGAEPPMDAEALKGLCGLLNTPEVRGFISQMSAIEDTDTFTSAATGPAVSFSRMVAIAIDILANDTGTAYSYPKRYIGPFTSIPQTTRAAIRAVSVELADALDQAHPAFQPFPAPANPGALPTGKAGRRQFLVNVLEQYRQKELNGPERGVSVHGRGHIARTYIFANVFCNILKEQNIPVDENAVILGISGHDLGRAGLGSDTWEEQSGQKTGEAIEQVFGQGVAGPAYSREIKDSIAGVKVTLPDNTTRSVPRSPTLEAQLLNNADCLDIGRTASFDPKYFDFLRDKNGTVTPEAQKIRDELVKEADLLQRLTNPLCANRQTLDRLSMDMMEEPNPRISDQLSEQKAQLTDAISDSFIHDAETVGNEEYFKRFEDVIAEHRDMFPLLAKYYLDAE